MFRMFCSIYILATYYDLFGMFYQIILSRIKFYFMNGVFERCQYWVLQFDDFIELYCLFNCVSYLTLSKIEVWCYVISIG